MNRYFNINYEFDRQAVWDKIDEQLQKEGARYICVAKSKKQVIKPLGEKSYKSTTNKR